MLVSNTASVEMNCAEASPGIFKMVIKLYATKTAIHVIQKKRFDSIFFFPGILRSHFVEIAHVSNMYNNRRLIPTR